MKLTERRIRDLEPLSRQYFEFDDDLPGFGVRVGATGAKSFVVRYRVGGGRSGRQRRMSLGAVGTISLTEARAKARECLRTARQGGDPLGEVERYREAPTMNDLLSRYLTEHAEPKKAAYSALEDRRKIDGILRPTFGAHKAAEITREDIERLHRSMADRPVMANRTLALASKVFQLAEKWRIRPEHSNPCRLVERYREEPRDRYFTIDEMAALGAALDALEAGTAKDRDGVPYPVGNTSAVLALRLAAFLGLRIGEISAMRWQNIDLKEATLRLPETKTGARFLTLPTEAQILLSNAPRIGECVVPGNNPDRPLDYKAIHRVWARARDIAGLRNARIHDIRHTVATMAAETGAGAHVIRDLIGHKTLAMANRYVGRMNAPVRDLRQSVAGTIGAAMAGGKDQRQA